jgi:hypothetical protein
LIDRKYVWTAWAVVAAVFAVWWFFIADWLISPHSPRAGVFYVSVVLITAAWHLRALYRFNKMTRLLRSEEKAGIAPPGSTTFAANQRFRYAMRAAESVVVLIIGILAVVATYNPTIQYNPSYIRLVLTYFIGSVLLTGFLTIRDLWVLNHVRKLAQDNEDAAALTQVTHGEIGPSQS